MSLSCFAQRIVPYRDRKIRLSETGKADLSLFYFSSAHRKLVFIIVQIGHSP